VQRVDAIELGAGTQRVALAERLHEQRHRVLGRADELRVRPRSSR
jgi:hypothetical protein